MNTAEPSESSKTSAPSIDLVAGAVPLTRQLVDIYSESHHEQEIADAVEPALRAIENVEVTRRGNTLVARTHRGLGDRVILAGHLDTVPPADNLPSRLGPDLETGEQTILSLKHI